MEGNNYQYNGIELVEDFGLHVNHALFRTLDPQTGAWWQIDPMAEKFYAWSPYNSNLDNPIRYDDPKGDCVNCAVRALVGAAIEYGFQVGQNYSSGIRGSEMFYPSSWTKIGVSFGAGLITGGLSIPNQINGKLFAFGVNRVIDGTVSATESYIKQSDEVANGTKKPYQPHKF